MTKEMKSETIEETVYEKFANFMKYVRYDFFITNAIKNKKIGETIFGLSIEELEQKVKNENKDVYVEYETLKEEISIIENLEKDTSMHRPFPIVHLMTMSKFLSISPLTVRERVEVMLGLIEKNIAWVENYNRLANMYNEFINLAKKRKEIDESTPTVKNDEYKELEEINNLLKKYYYDVKDSYNSEDIAKFVSKLKEMKLNPIICSNINSILHKKLKKRVSYIAPIKTEKVTEDVVRLTQKEYKTIYHEIKTKYFDLDEMKAIRILSLEEIISCTSLLLQLGMNKDQIDKVIKIMEKENKKSRMDILTQYREVSEKLEYYGQKEVLSQYIDVLATTAKKDADYEFWLMELEQELENVMGNLKDNHEYEIEKAAELVKINNQSTH